MTPLSKEEAIRKVLREAKEHEFDDVRRVLDALRKTRQSRGGTGAPLDVPGHLRQPIIFTDADEKASK